jgi:hypothetical protein
LGLVGSWFAFAGGLNASQETVVSNTFTSVVGGEVIGSDGQAFETGTNPSFEWIVQTVVSPIFAIGVDY